MSAIFTALYERARREQSNGGITAETKRLILKFGVRAAIAAALSLTGCAAFGPGCADYYNSVCPTLSFGVTLDIPLAQSKDLKRKHEPAEEQPIIEEEIEE